MNIEIIENRRLWEVDHRVEATTSGMTIFMNGKSEDFDLSHLAEDGEYLLEDCMELEYNPVLSIKKDGDKVTVSVFYDNPYEYTEEWVCPFVKKGKVIKFNTAPAIQARISEIDSRLAEIDQKVVRPMRAIVAGTATEQDTWKVNELEQEAVDLRAERKTLVDSLEE